MRNKEKPVTSFIIENNIKIIYIKLQVIKLLKKRVASFNRENALQIERIDFILRNLDIKVQEFIYFYSRVRNYCLFTGKSRSIYLNMVSRFKIKQYQSFGLLAGLRRSRH